jgi:hypothetical protein
VLFAFERLGPVARAGQTAAMGSKKAKTALDEIIAARNAKQSQKSVKQLYIEASGALNPKVRGAPLPLRARVRACGGRVRACRRTKV